MKRCFIIRPGRIGDIIIILPIAKYYADRGYKVYWFVYHELSVMFEYVNYVHPIPLFCSSIFGGARLAYRKLKNEINLLQDDLVIDLSIGFAFSKVYKEWISTNLSFDKWEYKKANVPFSEKWNLRINRKKEKEKILADYMKVQSNDTYSVIHPISIMGSFYFHDMIRKYQNEKIRLIEIEEIKGFTVFDWIGIIERAKWIYCVDSCVANLVNQLGLCKGRRIFKFLQSNRKQYQFVMRDDWIIL